MGLDGRPTRLELATEAGMLTLHPEPDGASMHGNTVTPWGLHHHALRWSSSHMLVVVGAPLAGAVAVRLLAERVGVGEGASVPAVEVGPGLVVREATWRVARVAPERWRLLPADGGPSDVVELGDDGIPLLADGETWPLERD